VSSTSTQILRIIKLLPQRKAPGHDNIRNIDLRNLQLNDVTHLTKIINAAFRFHCFPKIWKEANVISIPTPNKIPAFPQERQPIRLLDTVGKIRGKTLYRQIYPALAYHIPDEQFFSPGRDATLQLLRFTMYVMRSSMSGHTQQPYSLTFQSRRYGLDNRIHLQLEYRIAAPFYQYHTLLIASVGSKWREIRAGAPQGAVLAPLLYVADIPRKPGIETSQFADDTATFTSNKNINYAVSKFQRYIPDLESWQYKWEKIAQIRALQ
jgi:hypothetical protein